MNRDTLTYFICLIQFQKSMSYLGVCIAETLFGLITYFELIVTMQMLFPHRFHNWYTSIHYSIDHVMQGLLLNRLSSLVPQVTHYLPINNLFEQQCPIFVSKFSLTWRVSCQIVQEKLQIASNNVYHLLNS